MKAYTTSILLWLALILGELHSYFPDGPETYNLILRKYVPMTANWNVWFIGVNVQWLLLIMAIRFYRHNKHNRVTIRVFTYFAIIDIFLYFYNWKTYEYGKVYIWMAAAWLLMYYWKQITAFLWLQFERSINPYR